MFSPRKLIGLALYFVGIGIWVILLGWVAVWAAILVVPTVLLAFVAGYFTNFFKRTQEWPAFKTLRIWGWARRDYFRFSVYGNPQGIELMEKYDEPGESVLYAIYPHGHYSLSALFFWALDPKWGKAKAAIHSALFHVPLIGALSGWLGATSVTEPDLRVALHDNGVVYMCPGGVADIANTGHTIKKRRGFLRVAKEAGSTVIPIWCPEERTYYRQWLPLGTTLERWLFFPIPIIIVGRWWCPLLPLAPPARGSRIGVGKPLRGNELTWDTFETELKKLF